jgi:DNA-binding SARP family transcriptional activator/predicted ATPase
MTAQNVSIELLGQFRLLVRGGLVSALPVRAQAIVAYLAATGNPVPRDKVAEIIWPSRAEEQARQSLRQAIFAVRQALGDFSDTTLIADPGMSTLSLRNVSIDFSVLAECPPSADRKMLEHVTSIFRGEFLADFPPISEEFDEWCRNERTRTTSLATDFLRQLAAVQAKDGDHDEAIVTLRRLLGFDPFREDGHRLLMEVYARGGRKAEAIRHYETFALSLRRHLDTVPDTETTALAKKLRSSSLKEADSSFDPPTEALLEGPPSDPEPEIGSPGERRQLTVAFCNLSGSNKFLGQMDPEDFANIAKSYRQKTSEIIHRFDGVVAQYVGNGVLIYFGYPIAHEDDAERAVSASLAIVAEVGKFEQMTPFNLEVRVGIATGLVVIEEQPGTLQAAEKLAVGAAPNLAVGLQALAPAGGVLIEGTTQSLVGRIFELEEIRTAGITGFEQVSTYRVKGLSAVRSRFEAFQSQRQSPLINRIDEAELISRRWEQAKEGEGQVVLLSGEGGIGKSRIADHVSKKFESSAHRVLRYCGSPLHTQSVLYPFITQFSQSAGIQTCDPAELKSEKIKSIVSYSNNDATLISEFILGLVKDSNISQDSTAHKKRETVLRALLYHFCRTTQSGTALAIVEDAQWMDPTSLDLLNRTVAESAKYPILLIITARPEFTPAWTNEAHVSVISLRKLNKKDSQALVRGVANGKPLPTVLMPDILTRTDGVPLFIEELTKSLIESGQLIEEPDKFALREPFSAPSVPTSLQSSLIARIDHLGSARGLAQIGAAIGREFSYQLIRRVTGLPVHALDEALSKLVSSGLVHIQGGAAEALYFFKHALVQDIAYQTILKSSRRVLHGKIVRALLDGFPSVAENQPEVLAHHLTLAEEWPEAIKFWLLAGKAQITRSGDREAVEHLERGLSLIIRLGDQTQRETFEIQLLVAIIGSLVAIKGPWADQVGKYCERGLFLANKSGNLSLVFPFLYGQYTYNVSSGHLSEAVKIAASFIENSKATGYQSGLVVGHRLLGLAQLPLGEFHNARRSLETSLALYDSHRDEIVTYLFGQNVKINSQTVLSLALYLIGEVELSKKVGYECLRAALLLKHPHSTAISINYFGCWVLAFCGNSDEVYEQAHRLTDISDEFGLGMFSTVGRFFCGWADFHRGEREAGIKQMELALRAAESTSFRLGVPGYFAFLAEAQLTAGNVDEAQRLCGRAKELMEICEERWLASEILSIEACILLSTVPADAQRAQILFNEAVARAEALGSPTFKERCMRRKDAVRLSSIEPIGP